jgi:hypothetical protein
MKLKNLFYQLIKANNSFLITLFIIILTLTIYYVGFKSYLFGWDISVNDTPKVNYTIQKQNSIPSVFQSQIDQYETIKRDNYELHLQKMEIEAEVAKVEAFFSVYTGGAVMKGYGRILVEQARACGGDYRILVGIAGNESGLGRSPYKLYNPFGYLDNTQYESWEQSLTKLSCVISQRFIAPCKGDLRCIVQNYGGPETDQERWIQNVRWFMSHV